jgi:hypothetical protein
LFLVALMTASTVVATAAVAPSPALGAMNPIHPDNRPSAIIGATNGRLGPSQLLQVSPRCLTYSRAAPSIVSLLAAARRDGITLIPSECYRDYDGQVKVREQWCARGACHMAAVPGTSNHGWGKAVDFNDQNGTLTFDSAAYSWLKAHAGWFGWNHPGVMEPGGPVPEPWHWEWVGDGGRMYPGTNFGFGAGFGIALGGNPVGSLDSVTFDSLTGWTGTATVGGWTIDPDTASSNDVHVYVDGVGVALRANKPRADITELFAGYGSSPHGFSGSITATYGKRQVCAFGINVAGAGQHTLLNCATATIGRDPIGSVDLMSTGTGINVKGWALDADQVGAIDVHAYVNNVFAGATTANRARGDVDAVFPGNGTGHGYELSLPAQQGVNNVCLYGINVGAGANVALGCRMVATSRVPFGALDVVSAGPGGVTVAGWAIDPDTSGAIEVHTYIDGRGAGGTITGLARNDVGAVYPAYGPNRGYLATYPAAPGRHDVCTYGINVGAGQNVLLGCRTVWV